MVRRVRSRRRTGWRRSRVATGGARVAPTLWPRIVIARTPARIWVVANAKRDRARRKESARVAAFCGELARDQGERENGEVRAACRAAALFGVPARAPSGPAPAEAA